MIDRVNIEAHIASLTAQRDQLVANTNAVNGALQFAQAILTELDTPPASEEVVAEAKSRNGKRPVKAGA